MLGVYKDGQWRFIEEHLHDMLGKQCKDHGDTEQVGGLVCAG